MESLGTIWAVGLSVLGIYVYKRSEDKKLGTQSYSSVPKYSSLETSNPSSSIESKQSYND